MPRCTSNGPWSIEVTKMGRSVVSEETQNSPVSECTGNFELARWSCGRIYLWWFAVRRGRGRGHADDHRHNLGCNGGG